MSQAFFFLQSTEKGNISEAVATELFPEEADGCIPRGFILKDEQSPGKLPPSPFNSEHRGHDVHIMSLHHPSS